MTKNEIKRVPLSELPDEVPLPTNATFMGEPFEIVDDFDPGGSSKRGPHRRMAASKCDMMLALRYLVHLRSTQANSWTSKGSMFHLYAAYYYARRTPEAPAWWGRVSFKAERDKIVEPFNPKARAEMIEEDRLRFNAYRAWSKGEDLVPLFAERGMAATIAELDGREDDIGREILTARKDLVARVDGKLTDVDYKTKAGNRRWDKLEKFDEAEFPRDRQILENLAISRARFKEPIDDFMIRRVKREASFDIADDFVAVDWRAHKGVAARARRTVQTEIRVADRVRQGKKIRENGLDSNACFGRFGPCDYFNVCGAQTRDDRLVQIGRNFTAPEGGVESALHCFGE